MRATLWPLSPPPMTDDPSRLPVSVAFAGIAGAGPASRTSPPTLAAEIGEALRPFFDAHPSIAYVQFELALTEDGEDLEFAGGSFHEEDGTPVRDGREAHRAGEAFRRLTRADPHVREMPVALLLAMEGLEHTFRIAREATGAAPPVGQPADVDARAAARERARLEAQDARFDQRDELRDDDHVA